MQIVDSAVPPHHAHVEAPTGAVPTVRSLTCSSRATVWRQDIDTITYFLNRILNVNNVQRTDMKKLLPEEFFGGVLPDRDRA